MSELAALTKRQILTELCKSPHGNLSEYLPVGRQAASEDPHFFAHLVAWNHAKGEVRDAKAALPVVALAVAQALPQVADPAYVENALACLADLDPRTLVQRAWPFAGGYTGPTRWPRPPKPAEGQPPRERTPRPALGPRVPLVSSNLMRRLVARYLRELELAPPRERDRTAILHRRALGRLYRLGHVRPSDDMRAALRSRALGNAGGPVVPTDASVFADLKRLAAMTPDDIGAAVAARIPYLVARGALAARLREPAVLAAVVRHLRQNDVTQHMKALVKLGVQEHPETRAALEVALATAGRAAPKGTRLKATQRAADLERAGEAEAAAQLRRVQEAQLAQAAGVEGDWLVLGDRSGSMEAAIEGAAIIAATLARMVKGRVHLVFFDTTPTYYDATGKTYDEVLRYAGRIRAGGGTSIGCGLQLLLDRKLHVDGIALVSDGGENETPYFRSVYPRYAAALDVEPTVYWYQVGSVSRGWTATQKAAEIDVQAFDLTGGVDRYALPNLVQTMRVGRYSLIDEVMATPLRTLDATLRRTAGMPVLPQGQAKPADLTLSE